MKTEMTLSEAAWIALHTLAWEYLAKGGNLPSITMEAVEEAFNALGEADRIVRADEEESDQ